MSPEQIIDIKVNQLNLPRPHADRLKRSLIDGIRQGADITTLVLARVGTKIIAHMDGIYASRQRPN